MKTIFLLWALFATINCLPFNTDPEYAMVSDIDGTLKLINVDEDPDPEISFDPQTDVKFRLYTKNGPTEGAVIYVHNNQFDGSR